MEDLGQGSSIFLMSRTPEYEYACVWDPIPKCKRHLLLTKKLYYKSKISYVLQFFSCNVLLNELII